MAKLIQLCKVLKKKTYGERLSNFLHIYTIRYQDQNIFAMKPTLNKDIFIYVFWASRCLNSQESSEMPGFDPWVRKISWSTKRQQVPVFLP